MFVGLGVVVLEVVSRGVIMVVVVDCDCCVCNVMKDNFWIIWLRIEVLF